MVTDEKRIKADTDCQSGVTIIKPQEDLDFKSSCRMRKSLMRILKKDSGNAVIDLSEVGRVDTSGLATLVEFALELEKDQRSLSVCGLREQATDSLSLEQVRDVLNLSSSCKDAVQKVKNENI